jgi:drug/metabolite transporter (DMT)-like permease
MLICIAGILLLISKGSWQILASFHFSTGDVWVLAGAFAFAVYNILVRKKPAGIIGIELSLCHICIGNDHVISFFICE